jgi:LysR family transcriptional regulator, chromosome initiation inhibitor
MYLDLGQLQALQAAVDTGTLDGAAQRLHVTPSAISQRIKALETTIGRALLVRSRPVTTTPAGERVLTATRNIRLIGARCSRCSRVGLSRPAVALISHG